MNQKASRRDVHRSGVIVVFAAVMIVVLAGMLSFSVDYGYLLKTRTDLQRSADASALAAVRDLIRKDDGTQDLDQVRATARTYAQNNLSDSSFQVATGDIEIGRYDPQSIYSDFTLLGTGTFDAVRVTLRRDGATNPSVPLFFARLLGKDRSTVLASATAVLQKAEIMSPGAAVLPFATPISLWNGLSPGQTWCAYGDGKLKDLNGNNVPGDWGTLDIGPTGNSSADLNDQILNGLKQSDLNALHGDGRISQNSYIDSAVPAWMQGDTGLSSGLKQSVQAVHGEQRLIPLYDDLGGHLTGNNVDFHVVGWGVVTVIDSGWQGQTNTYVIVRKSHLFNGKLRPISSLSSGSGYIDGAYTSPVLVK